MLFARFERVLQCDLSNLGNDLSTCMRLEHVFLPTVSNLSTQCCLLVSSVFLQCDLSNLGNVLYTCMRMEHVFLPTVSNLSTQCCLRVSSVFYNVI
jgi:hypothetical protein